MKYRARRFRGNVGNQALRANIRLAYRAGCGNSCGGVECDIRSADDRAQ